ncbi:unnamed protein product [Cladocopium goreaui]|uniref:Glycosyltransferase 2-like domain-containing protein n=1 Tax=Cladocopium goreaui TaxID=2562237 RepID=A0A9P1GT35_9DINO|nr:unnamed protein product [Cladocopium goreaui]
MPGSSPSTPQGVTAWWRRASTALPQWDPWEVVDSTREAWVPPYDDWAKQAEREAVWFIKWRSSDSDLGFNFLYKDGQKRHQYPRRDDWNDQVRLCCNFAGENYLEVDPDAELDFEIHGEKFDEKAYRVSSTDTTRDQTPMSENVYEALRDPDVLLQVLQLNEERLLRESPLRSDPGLVDVGLAWGIHDETLGEGQTFPEAPGGPQKLPELPEDSHKGG